MNNRLRFSLFGGIVPRLADRGLPDNAAQFAMNAKLTSGELRAWNRMKSLSVLDFPNPLTVFHYRHEGAERYLAFPVHTYVVQAPLINEQLGRLYWSNEFGLFVNTTARLEAAQPEFKLGLPTPGGTFTVVPSGGTAELAETRVYTVIFVSSFGEESAPGAVVSVNGNGDGSWTVNGLNALTYSAGTYPNITKLRLYRTITSATGVDYREVAEWAIGSRPASYADTVASTVLASKPVLQSLGWEGPPDGLQGLIGVAGGFLAGFKDRTVYLSVPYYPHAWPVDFQFAVEDKIVGLGTFGNTIVVCTEGRGALLVGQIPEAMSLLKLDGVQPCLSARSIVNTIAGVMYASTDGLVLVDGASNQGQIVSRAWVTKDEWMSQFGPKTQLASVYQDRYFAFYTSQLGFTVGFDDAVSGFTELQADGVSSVDLDLLTGQVLVTIGNTVYEWDGDPTASLTYSWKSKPMQLPKPSNMGVIQLRGTFTTKSGGGGGGTGIPAQGSTGYAMNQQGLNGGKTTANKYGGSLNGPPLWMAIGDAPAPPAPGAEIMVKVYGDGVLQWFGSINSEKPYRLPSGQKYATYEVEVEGAAQLFSITLAETAKALEEMP